VQLTPQVAQSVYFLLHKFNPENLTGFPWAEASNKGGMVKRSYFLALCLDISKTVRDTTKVTT